MKEEIGINKNQERVMCLHSHPTQPCALQFEPNALLFIHIDSASNRLQLEFRQLHRVAPGTCYMVLVPASAEYTHTKCRDSMHLHKLPYNEANVPSEQWNRPFCKTITISWHKIDSSRSDGRFGLAIITILLCEPTD